MENNNEINSQGFPNSNSNYPISSSANSNPSKTPPQGYQSHQCQFSDTQSQMMLHQQQQQQAMYHAGGSHYGGQIPPAVRHPLHGPVGGGPGVNPDNCHHYAPFQTVHSGPGMPHIPANAMHPSEMIHVMGGPGGGYHQFSPAGSQGYVPATMQQQQQQQMESATIVTLCPQCQKELFLPNPGRPQHHHQHQQQQQQQPIQCSYSCGHWYHRACTGLSPEAYQLLRSHELSVEWICKSCEAQFAPRIWYIKPRQQPHPHPHPAHPPPPGYLVNKFMC